MDRNEVLPVLPARKRPGVAETPPLPPANLPPGAKPAQEDDMTGTTTIRDLFAATLLFGTASEPAGPGTAAPSGPAQGSGGATRWTGARRPNGFGGAPRRPQSVVAHRPIDAMVPKAKLRSY